MATVPGRREVIATHREAGGRVAAVFPIHAPRALLRAHGFLPVEVWGPPGVDTGLGDVHLQAYACSIVRCGLAFQQAGGLDDADVLVVPHACDSLQGLASVLMDFVRPRTPVLPLYLPRGRRDSDRAFLAAELRAMSDRLAALSGVAPESAELLAASAREEEADALLARLHAERTSLSLDDADLYALIRSREFLPAEAFADLARGALQDASPRPARGIPIILSGIVPEPRAIFDVLAEAGGRVAADDLAACGRRLYPAGDGDDPFHRMAGRLLDGPPDPTRGSPIGERVAWLRRLAHDSGAKGVVFFTVKFCEPELFDLPLLRKALDAAGLPSITVEADINQPLPQQVTTRLEAFLEMLS